MPEDKRKKQINTKKAIDIKKIVKYFNNTLTIIELFLTLTIIFLFYFSKPITTKRVIFIPQGSTKHIITYLSKNYPLSFIDFLLIKTFNYPQSGWIDLKQTNLTKYDFLKKLTTSKAALKNIQLTPGETYYFFLKQSAKDLKIDEKRLFYFYNKYKFRLDGNIIAQTFNLPIGMDEKDFILYLFRYTNNYYKKISNQIYGEYDKINWYKIVTIASIIQKEAANKDEMPLIASVIYNRLKKNMKLQMDGSLNYGKYSHTPVSPQRIKKDNSDYNTYKYKGIPKNPVCNVSFDAIKATIYPSKTNYLYFVKSANGKKHYFTRNYKNHLKLVKRLKKKKSKTNRYKIKRKQQKQYQRKKQKRKKYKKSDIKNLWKSVL